MYAYLYTHIQALCLIIRGTHAMSFNNNSVYNNFKKCYYLYIYCYLLFLSECNNFEKKNTTHIW